MKHRFVRFGASITLLIMALFVSCSGDSPDVPKNEKSVEKAIIGKWFCVSERSWEDGEEDYDVFEEKTDRIIRLDADYTGYWKASMSHGLLEWNHSFPFRWSIIKKGKDFYLLTDYADYYYQIKTLTDDRLVLVKDDDDLVIEASFEKGI